MATLLTYITETFAKLNETRGSSPNYPDSMVISAINAARTNLWNGTIYNYSRKEYVRPGMVFDWQKDYAYFKSYDIRYLSEDIATLGDTNLYLDADGLPATGQLFLRDNRIGYSANNTTDVTI